MALPGGNSSLLDCSFDRNLKQVIKNLASLAAIRRICALVGLYNEVQDQKIAAE